MSQVFLTILFILSQAIQASEQVNVKFYTYHDKPPYFYMDKTTSKHVGVYMDICGLMMEADNNFKCEVSLKPRVRIDRDIEDKDFKDVVIGINPKWVKDPHQEKYNWSDKIFEDVDIIISNPKTPVEFNVKDFKGKNFSAVRGHFYHTINDLIKSKEVTRSDVSNDVQTILMVQSQRADFAIISRATFRYYIATDKIPMSLHIAKLPHDIFDRYFLIGKGNKDLQKSIDQILTKAKNSPKWQLMIAKHYLQ